MSPPKMPNDEWSFASNDPAVLPDQDLRYTYDAAGNRTRTVLDGVTTDYVSNGLNQYTTIGTGHDQGRTSGAAAAAVVAESLQVELADLGTTTFRPPYVPVPFAALAGRERGALSDPARVTAVMLLAGVEPLLTASPTATRDIMSGWNLGGGGDAGQ